MTWRLASCKKRMTASTSSHIKMGMRVLPYVLLCPSEQSHIVVPTCSPISLICFLRVPTVRHNPSCCISTRMTTSASYLRQPRKIRIIRKYTKTAPVEVLKFFRIVVFNYLILNDDAHLKNFSLMNRGNGEYHLTPAYDLINTSLHLYEPRIFALDKGLFREGMQFSDTHTVGRKDFEEFGRRIGLSPRLVNRELDFFATEHPLAQELISRSFLSEQLKRYYWQSYNYRRTTLTSHYGE